MHACLHDAMIDSIIFAELLNNWINHSVVHACVHVCTLAYMFACVFAYFLNTSTCRATQNILHAIYTFQHENAENGCKSHCYIKIWTNFITYHYQVRDTFNRCIWTCLNTYSDFPSCDFSCLKNTLKLLKMLDFGVWFFFESSKSV